MPFINEREVHRLVRDYHPAATETEIDHRTRETIRMAEIALFTAARGDSIAREWKAGGTQGSASNHSDSV